MPATRKTRLVRHGGLALLVGVTITALLLAGGPEPEPAEASWLADPWITTQAKIALLTSEGLAANDIRVDTVAGRVFLHGVVHDGTARERAERAVGSIERVRDVENRLQVVPRESLREVSTGDRRLEREVANRLADALDGSRIYIRSVNKGVVLLAGIATHPVEHLVAIRTVRATPGVRAVPSEVRIDEKAIPRNLLAGRELRTGGRGLVGALDDLRITLESKLALLADPEVPALDVNVDTTAGAVTLFGTVPDDGARERAEAAVRRQSGVVDVQNKLEILPASRRTEVRRRDRELLREVEDAISAQRALKGSVVRADVRNGVARLTGTVGREDLRLVAVLAARNVPGIRSVEEELRVRNVVTRRAG